MIDFERVVDFFKKESVYCFTSDIDWAPELAIQQTLKLFNELKIPLTPFITHDSEAVKKQYREPGKTKYVALHPNFLPDSSHGNNYLEQIDFVKNLWPEAKCFRAHSYFDNSQITHEFYKRGFRYDSNLCLFLHPYCTPLRHQSGLIRFPVFWEDDAHWERFPFEPGITNIKRYIDLPGLKVFNFHPLNIALNTPSADYYRKHKFLYHTKLEKSEELERYTFQGRGVRTFLEDLVTYLQKQKISFYYFHDLYQELIQKFPMDE